MRPVPNHVAIVMAGSARWAERHRQAPAAGHAAALQAARATLTAAARSGIRFITLCPDDDEDAASLERLEQVVRLTQGLRGEIAALRQQGVEVRLVKSGGRKELVAATRALAVELQSQRGRRLNLEAEPQTVMELDIERLLPAFGLDGAPDPDLVVLCGRTGHQRLTDYLLFAAAYAEFHFSAVLWPDFTPADLEVALADFSHRERRFGKTSDQLKRPPAPASDAATASSLSP